MERWRRTLTAGSIHVHDVEPAAARLRRERRRGRQMQGERGERRERRARERTCAGQHGAPALPGSRWMARTCAVRARTVEESRAGASTTLTRAPSRRDGPPALSSSAGLTSSSVVAPASVVSVYLTLPAPPSGGPSP